MIKKKERQVIGLKIDMEDIECFLTVARQMSFTRAAALLFQTQPTVSRRVAHLEEELGAALFDRTGKTLQLTREGEKAFIRLSNIQRELRQLHSDICQRENLRGTLKIGCYGVYDYQIVSDISAQIGKKYPDVQLEYYVTEPGQGTQDLIEGRTDLLMGVRCELEIADGIEMQLLMPQRMVAMVHPASLFARRESISMKELHGVQLALWKRENAPQAYDGVVRACRQNGFEPRICDHIIHRQEMPIALMGEQRVTILPEGCHFMAKEMGVVVPVKDLNICVDYCLAYRKDRISPEIRCFFEEAGALREEKKWAFDA